MRFLRSKAAVIAIGVMTVLCLVAIGISIKISLIMLERRDQLLKYGAGEDRQPVYQAGKQPNMSRLKEKPLFFNGVRCEDAAAYVDDEGNFFLPIDYLLKKIGISIRLYEPDDMVEYEVDGINTVMRLGEDMTIISGSRVKLAVPPVGAKNHILAPEDLFSRIPGFTANLAVDQETVHINYYKNLPKEAGRLKVLKKNAELVYLTNIFNNELFWSALQSADSTEVLRMAATGDRFLIKLSQDAYLYGGDGSYPRSVDLPANAKWSADGKLLYWIDWEKRTSFVYDISSGETAELGDYYFRLFDKGGDDSLILGYDVLYGYKEDDESRRIILTNNAHEGNYTFIESKDGELIQGSCLYSPDGSRIIYSVEGEGYFTATANGKDIAFIGNGVEVRWVNNNRIFLRTNEGEMLVYSVDQKRAEVVDTDWRKVGQAADGGVFYTASGYLHYEKDGIETSLMEMPDGCGFVFAGSSEGSYITVCNSTDSVNYVAKGQTIKLGNYSSLLGRIDFATSTFRDNAGFTLSPDGRIMAAFFKEDGLTKMIIMRADEPDTTDIMLNIPTQSVEEVEKINFYWLSEEVLILYTPHKGWIIDLKAQPDIYSWEENEGIIIHGIMP